MSDFFTLCTGYWQILLFISVISYLIGGISFSIIATNIFCGKTDIRSLGSGNAGFTNVLRTSGKIPAIVTFAGDFLKGVFCVWLGKSIAALQPEIAENNNLLQYVAYIAGFMCVLGHIYPCFFGFKGGKGILTGWSVTLLIDWRVFIIIICVFLVVLAFTRIVSLSSICAASSYPIVTFILTYIDYRKYGGDIHYTAVCTVISLLTAAIVVIKHKSNISRLISGEEKQITAKN